MLTTGTIVAITGTIYICIGILLSGAIYQIVTKSGKDYDDGSLTAVMFFNVLFWPIMFYWVYKEIKDNGQQRSNEDCFSIWTN